MGIEKNVLKHATLVDGSEQTSEATNDRQLSFDFEVRACKYANDDSLLEMYFENTKEALSILNGAESFLRSGGALFADEKLAKINHAKELLERFVEISLEPKFVCDDDAVSASFQVLRAAEKLSKQCQARRSFEDFEPKIKKQTDAVAEKLKKMFDGPKVDRITAARSLSSLEEEYYEAPMKAREGKFEKLAREAGQLTDEKNRAYGDSFLKAGEFLALVYPNGISPEHYTDALCLVRIFDKLMRIGTKKDAFGESPYKDILGYSLLGLANDERKKTLEEPKLQKPDFVPAKELEPLKKKIPVDKESLDNIVLDTFKEMLGEKYAMTCNTCRKPANYPPCPKCLPGS